MLNELSDENARLILSAHSVARLGCVLESGEPYVVPINYYYKNGAIYCHSVEGLKIAALRANPKICLQVDEIKSAFEWRSAIAFGEFEEIVERNERAEILETILKGFQKLTPAEAVSHESGAAKEIVLFRINIRRVTGRAEN